MSSVQVFKRHISYLKLPCSCVRRSFGLSLYFYPEIASNRAFILPIHAFMKGIGNEQEKVVCKLLPIVRNTLHSHPKYTLIQRRMSRDIVQAKSLVRCGRNRNMVANEVIPNMADRNEQAAQRGNEESVASSADSNINMVEWRGNLVGEKEAKGLLHVSLWPPTTRSKNHVQHNLCSSRPRRGMEWRPGLYLRHQRRPL
eukprot:scaffold13537_cov77-Skeletonema_dohrnii-CCMP3373.AAC.5